MFNVFLSGLGIADPRESMLEPLELDLSYEMLDPLDDEMIESAADCLAESFTGVQIKGSLISEPMIEAIDLPREDFYEFVRAYLQNVVNQRLCFVARDKRTGIVEGVLACEDLDPDEEPPVFEGNLAPMNKIIEFLMELDMKFFEVIEQKIGQKIKYREYVHAFMGGVRTNTSKRYVLIKLFEILIGHAANRGYKAVFGEATNPRSAIMCVESCGFKLVNDLNDEPLLLKYHDYEIFKTVPKENSEDCRIVYRALHPDFEL